MRKSYSSASSKILFRRSRGTMVLVGFWKLGIMYSILGLLPSASSFFRSASRASGLIPLSSKGTFRNSG